MREILRRIREEEPPRPSTRLSESKESLPSVAARRRTEPARLTKQVRGELDWIVMKAIEKDRTGATRQPTASRGTSSVTWRATRWRLARRRRAIGCGNTPASTAWHWSPRRRLPHYWQRRPP